MMMEKMIIIIIIIDDDENDNDEDDSDDDADIIEFKLQAKMQFDNTIAGEKLQITWHTMRALK